MGKYKQNGLSKIFSEIAVEKPADKIINQIRNLIRSGQLKPGDKLPPERKLVEQLGVGRGQVRDALRKLEFYGILKTMPQSGTVVAGMGVAALEGMIANVLEIEDPEFPSLVETRIILEVNAAQLAAERRTQEDLVRLSQALEAYRIKVDADDPGIEEDMLFHHRIAEASKNSVLRSLSLIITPDMIRYSRDLDICGDGRFKIALEEHETILEHIRSGDCHLAGEAMRAHLQRLETAQS